MAGTTRLELATSAVTGRRSNQLSYVPMTTIVMAAGRFNAHRTATTPLSVSERMGLRGAPRKGFFRSAHDFS